MSYTFTGGGTCHIPSLGEEGHVFEGHVPKAFAFGTCFRRPSRTGRLAHYTCMHLHATLANDCPPWGREPRPRASPSRGGGVHTKRRNKPESGNGPHAALAAAHRPARPLAGARVINE